MGLPDYAMRQPTFPEMYERFLVEPLFKPWAELLLDCSGLAADDRVIDLACGTGIVSRVARSRLGRSAKIVGIDLSPQMLGVARTVAPEMEWREGNADALPIGEDEKFDLLVCQQGLQFFPEKQTAALEMRRVLSDGGRAIIATWRPDSETPIFCELRRIAEDHLGPIMDQRHGFSDSEALKSLLEGAGFQDVSVETFSRVTRFEDPDVFIRMNAMALTGMSTEAKSMSDEERARALEDIITASSEVRARYADGNAISFETRSNVATLRK